MFEFIRAYPLGTVLFFIAVLIVTFVTSAYHWYKKTKKVRIIQDVPTSNIASAHQGYVELTGHGAFIKNGKTISLVSGRECIWYHYEVYKILENRRASSFYDLFSTFIDKPNEKKIADVRSDDLFYIEDETGRCVVVPDGAIVKAFNVEEWTGNHPYPGHAQLVSPLDSSEQYRYVERWIEPDEILYVLGDFITEGTGEAPTSIEDDAKEIIKLWKQYPEQYLRRYKRDEQDNILIEEWDRVTQDAKHAALEQKSHSAAIEQTHTLRKSKGKPFIISSFSEEELISKLKKETRLSFIVSIISLVALLYLITVRFL